ncbi:gluconate 2-dehydrogenase subunit 3 family protein [Edaphobacter paludis]|uniref:Gluconate 2-dehydrogenase subunit 3 family protein n=1 Tax=Edaphobacter paludis TaxID=3035702 RepID=A0AAU7CX38_9BACT
MNRRDLKQIAEEPDSALLPIDPNTGEALPPRLQPGYYAGFSTLSQQSFWDSATRKVVTERVDNPSTLRFFNADEAKFWGTVFDHLIPQTDRAPNRRIPILPALDDRLSHDRTAGYRFEDMPHDRDAYRLGLDAIQQEAQQRYGGDFLVLPHLQQDLVLKAIHDGKPEAAKEIWKRMSVHRFWQLIIGDAIEAYYAHPWAWDEIGFGGPAYPRAYMRLERGEAEPWEVEEHRYEWVAPLHSASDEIEATHEFLTEALQHRSHVKVRERQS